MKSIIQWCKERIRIKELQQELEHIYEGYAYKLSRINADSDNTSELAAEIFAKTIDIKIEMESIHTERRLRLASHYGLPTPNRLQSPDFWQQNPEGGDDLLTMRGHTYLRREIAFERDLLWKPVITWAALTISIFSFGLSACSLYTSSYTVSETAQTKAPH